MFYLRNKLSSKNLLNWRSEPFKAVNTHPLAGQTHSSSKDNFLGANLCCDCFSKRNKLRITLWLLVVIFSNVYSICKTSCKFKHDVVKLLRTGTDRSEQTVQTNRIYHRSSMQTEKSRVNEETEFPALYLDRKVGISLSASENYDYFSYLLLSEIVLFP